MRHFLQNIFLFTLPFILVVAPACLVFYKAGEFYSLSDVAKRSMGEKTILFGPAYSNYRAQLQQTATALRHPDVLALGNSRVGEFRGAFFKQPDLFYNATGAVGALSDFTNFLQSVEPYHPNILLVNMDHYFFDPVQAKNNVVIRPNPFLSQIHWYDVALEGLVRNNGWLTTYQDYLHHKYSLSQIFHPSTSRNSIGLRAVVENGGATNDGSDYYGAVISNSEVQKGILDSIQALTASISNTNGDWYGNSISPLAIEQLRYFLSYAKAHSIYVIGFLPPIAPSEYARIKSFPNATYASTFKTLGTTLSSEFSSYGFEFYDFSDISSIGGANNEMVDSKHGGEKMYLRMFIELAGKDPRLAEYADIPHLKQLLLQATSTYAVFGLSANK